jgi:phage terminase large subunit
VGLNEAKREIYIIDEIAENRLDMDDLVSFVDSFVYDGETVWADCSEKMEIHTITKKLSEYGIRAKPVSKYNGGGGKGAFKLHGILQLRSYTIYINEHCTGFAREIRSYAWQKDSQGKTIHIPEDGNDHYLDAGLFYALNSVFKARARTKVH